MNKKYYFSKDRLNELYINQLLSTTQIAKFHGCNSTTIWRYLKQFNIPIRNINSACSLRLSSKPSFEANSTLAYILGVVYGDGCLHKDAYGHSTIGLFVKDKDFADTFFNFLKSINLNPRKCTNKFKQFGVIAHSKLFVEEFDKKQSNLLLKIKKYVRDDRNNQIAFLRGFYDSEGCTYNKNNVLRVLMDNSDKNLIDYISELLENLDFEHHINNRVIKKQTQKPQWRIEIVGKRENKINYLKLINSSIKRKRIIV